MMQPSSGCRGSIASILLLTATSAYADTEVNLLTNGAFDEDLTHWNTTGSVLLVESGGWNGGPYARLAPTPGQTAELTQTAPNLKPQTRYTLAARVRTSDRLAPPIVGIRAGAQIEKAHGWVAVGDEGNWLERRLEVFTDDGATSLQVVLQGWQTDLDVLVDMDAIRLHEGRLTDLPEGEWPSPPSITASPAAGDEIIINGSFQSGTHGWSPGLHAEVVDDDGPAMRLTSTEDTSRCAQPVALSLPPETTWTVTCEARVDPGVVASMYVESSNGFSAAVPIDGTQWHPVSLEVRTDADWVDAPTVKLENWKNQPGAAWFRSVSWTATGDEWSPTTNAIPTAQLDPLHETFDHGLSTDDWLLSTKAWGGDNGGVSPKNITIVDDIDNGQSIKALRLEAHGDLYTGDVYANGRRTRVGSAIATREYFASGRYTVRARVAPELGAVTAFWPFHYIDYYPSEHGYWHEPNPRRNTEIDWEFPTDLMGSGEAQAAELGLDPSDIAFTNARTNAWGGQFGGEGGEHKGRIVLQDAGGNVVNLADDWHAGIYHDYTIEWHAGELDPTSNGDERLTTGCVRWYFDDLLVDELLDEEFGQGNVPFRGARFWLGVWFAAAGYGDHVGWGGSPDFDTTATYIASVSIEPFDAPRDTWVRETVPNLAWATPDAYPAALCSSDFDGDGEVGTSDVLVMLANWQSHGVDDLLNLLSAWGPCTP